jgi:hypothetical protein
MLTREQHSRLVSLAGQDFSWPAGGSKPTSKDGVRLGLSRFIEQYANGLCVLCGLFDGVEIAHIVSSGKGNGSNAKGYIPGNLGWTCRVCNLVDGEQWKVIPYDSIRHPELIPSVWPSRAELSDYGLAARLDKETDIQRVRQARRI